MIDFLGAGESRPQVLFRLIPFLGTGRGYGCPAMDQVTIEGDPLDADPQGFMEEREKGSTPLPDIEAADP